MFFKKRKPTQSAELDMANVPKHIGVIMDGNGRWAAKRGLPRSAGHRAGAEVLKKIVIYCNKIGVKCVTAYAFSTENWNRPQAEVDALMDLLYTYLSQVEQQFRGTNVILKVIGDRSALSEKINKAIDYAESYTSKNTGLILNVALNYGGRHEITAAAKHIVKMVQSGDVAEDEVDEKLLSKLMYTGSCPEVDLIIRPSGEYRLSNFLLWQSAYSELWFDSICWPDFTENDMERAIIDYQKRNRRFGGV